MSQLGVWPGQVAPVSLKITALRCSTWVREQMDCGLTADLLGDLEAGCKHASEVAGCFGRFTAKQLVTVGQHTLLYLISSFYCYNLQ